MRLFWSEVGPPSNIALLAIAAGLGVEFKTPEAGPEPNQDDAFAALLSQIPRKELADPFAVQSMLGQAEILPYHAPRKGFSLEEPTP
jgi:hypothetical protein